MSDEKDPKAPPAPPAAPPAAPATVTLTADELTRLISEATTKALKTAGVIGRPAPAPGTVATHRCEVCGHAGVPTDTGHCPNNNCPRHTDPDIVGLHPATGEPMRELEAYRAAKAEHQAAA